jgi:acetylornithine/N-succinyldiaminopimelate aminotransferase
LLGLKCVAPNMEGVARLRDAGLLTAAAGENVVRLMPPLNVAEAQLDEAARIIDGVGRNWERAEADAS